MNNIKEMNYRIFQYLSYYLNYNSDFIEKRMIDEMKEIGLSTQESFCYLLASYFDLNLEDSNDKILFDEYIKKMVQEQNASEYINDLYYQNIKCFNKIKNGNCELKYDSYKAFEGFVYDDIEKYINGKQLPKIGFFTKEFRYPAIYENNRLWMSITPNEINTMKEPIEKAFGNVLTYGLGLGYYAYMISLKDNVDSVTIVERNQSIIDLFNESILPFFNNKEKIKIIKADAFEFGESEIKNYSFDFVFVDLWHDVSDGLEMYKKMKSYEKNLASAKYMYWIEKTIKCYMD